MSIRFRRQTYTVRFGIEMIWRSQFVLHITFWPVALTIRIGQETEREITSL